MSKKPGARSIARAGVVYLAALAALTGVFVLPAAAEPPVPTSTAPATSEPTSSSPAPTPVESPSPAAAEPRAERPTVEASVVFEKAAYRSDENVRFTFKVTNVSKVSAVGLRINQWLTVPGALSIPYEPGWGELGRAPGMNLAPEGTIEFSVTGQIQDLDLGKAVVRGFVSDTSGFGVGSFDAEVAVTKNTGRATGVVFGDENSDGKLDDGEQLTGLPLTLRHAISAKEYHATSGPGGKIDFGDVPAARYFLSGDGIKGWLFPFRTIQVGEDTEDLSIRGVRPLNGALKASISFAKDIYKSGELAHLTVKLSNSGTRPLVGIVAGCNRVGNDFELTSDGAGWGELSTLGSGATILPGQTRVFDVTKTIPDAALNYGRVSVVCDFGYADVGLDGSPVAMDAAEVPGGMATLAGRLIRITDPGKPEVGLAGVKLVLTSDGDCPTVVETTTGADGRFKIDNIVTGPKYRLFFAPPQGWRMKNENPIKVYAIGPADNLHELRFVVEEGQEPPLTMPSRRPGCDASGTTTPAPGQQGSGGGQGRSGLASTGADVIWLGALALATLGLGAVLLLGTRRRRSVE
ncbi:hypothetical protein ACFQ05_15850 [Amycolatopsis umgeniensis]|uniref:SD-repeat containing protein B domain-containing protein n=1 Tax=Amycolatopsis umgeniensis TaxID=336628 RepID=A0A841B0W7_9PSEU|nr:hypothetical protein [Amycolatopsis umgeniensis]MBB5854779.1 hypothetical protein [Amycolatopsis umgeniensis]